MHKNVKKACLPFSKHNYTFQNANMTWKSVISLKKRERETEIHWVVISEVPNPMVIPWQFQKYNHTRGRLCQWDRCYPWKSFLLFLGSIWAFYVTKWWQIKDDSICNYHEHLNWVMYYKKYAWKRTPVLKVYTHNKNMCILVFSYSSKASSSDGLYRWSSIMTLSLSPVLRQDAFWNLTGWHVVREFDICSFKSNPGLCILKHIAGHK